jgi:DNA-binding transcriptional MerR regulator
MTPAAAPRLYDIGELAQELGVSARTIRYYEERGLLGTVRRRGGGRRVYGDPEVARLRFIQKLKLLGLSLDEIAELNDVHAHGSTRGMLERLIPKLDGRLAELENRMRELRALRVEITTYRSRMARRLEELA